MVAYQDYSTAVYVSSELGDHRARAKCVEAGAEHADVPFNAAAGFSRHANYCAANAAVDAMADTAATQGLPHTAVQWGAWSAVGVCCRVQGLGFRGIFMWRHCKGCYCHRTPCQSNIFVFIAHCLVNVVLDSMLILHARVI